MDQTNHNKTRILIIVLVISIIANVGLFFYGLINNIAMQKERAMSVELKVQAEKCRLEVEQAKQELQNALTEVRQAKDFALAQAALAARAAKEAAQNKK